MKCLFCLLVSFIAITFIVFVFANYSTKKEYETYLRDKASFVTYCREKMRLVVADPERKNKMGPKYWDCYERGGCWDDCGSPCERPIKPYLRFNIEDLRWFIQKTYDSIVYSTCLAVCVPKGCVFAPSLPD